MVPSDVGDGRSSAPGTDHTHAAESGGKTRRETLRGGRLRLRLGIAALCATGAAFGAIWAARTSRSSCWVGRSRSLFVWTCS